MDRPLCLALLTSWCTGDWALALPLGIIFELLWLDTLELGGVVPPYGGLSFLLAFPLCRHFGLTQAGAAPAAAVSLHAGGVRGNLASCGSGRRKHPCPVS